MSERYFRRHSKHHKGDRQRSEGERDHDRLVYSPALRRLAGITQVVSPLDNHVFHNRLTHTFKTAQIAKRIAQYLVKKRHEVIRDLAANDHGYEIDPDVVEAAALAHDLGHPPFGHLAEEVIHNCLKGIDDDGFDGNAQSFRIVTRLSVIRRQYRGLNLARATLCGILKYPWTHGPKPPGNRKWGYYSTEKDDFDFAQEMLPAGSNNIKTVEAEIMDWADDIAYSVHDLEDFYRAQLVPLNELSFHPEMQAEFIDQVFQRRKEEDNPFDFTKEEAAESLAQILNLSKSSGLDRQYAPDAKFRANLQIFGSRLIQRYIQGASQDGAENLPMELAPMEGNQSSRVEIARDYRIEVSMLKELVIHYVFHYQSLVSQQYGHREIIRRLFEVFYNATDKGVAKRSILPKLHVAHLEELEVSKDKHLRATARARVTADIIASMTEEEAIVIHQRFRGAHVGLTFGPTLS